MNENYEKLIQGEEQHYSSGVTKLEETLQVYEHNFAFAFELFLRLLKYVEDFSKNLCEKLSIDPSTVIKEDIVNWTKHNYQA